MYSNIIYRHITCWCEVPNPAGQHTVSTCTEHVLWVTGKTDVRRSASFVMMCRNTQCTILWTQKTYFNVVTEQRDKNTSKLLGSDAEVTGTREIRAPACASPNHSCKLASSALQNRQPVWSSNAHGRHIESHAGPQQNVKNDLKYFEKMTNSYNNFKFPKILHKEFLSAELSLEANISWGRKNPLRQGKERNARRWQEDGKKEEPRWKPLRKRHGPQTIQSLSPPLTSIRKKV